MRYVEYVANNNTRLRIQAGFHEWQCLSCLVTFIALDCFQLIPEQRHTHFRQCLLFIRLLLRDTSKQKASSYSTRYYTRTVVRLLCKIM